MILGNSSPIYPLWAFVMVAISMILVKGKNYKNILPHGILGTLIISATLAVSINLIKAWKYVEIEPFSIFGISAFILVAWGASIIIFLWALPLDLPDWTHYLYIASFSIIGVIIDEIFHDLGLRPYASWYRSWMWFFVMYGVFWINYKIFKIRLNYEKEKYVTYLILRATKVGQGDRLVVPLNKEDRTFNHKAPSINDFL